MRSVYQEPELSTGHTRVPQASPVRIAQLNRLVSLLCFCLLCLIRMSLINTFPAQMTVIWYASSYTHYSKDQDGSEITEVKVVGRG